MRLSLVVAALFLALAGPLAAQEAARRITVTGEAEVEAVPDLATVSAGVETRAPSAAAALAANSEAMARVFAALEAAGVERGDLQTSQLGLGPVYETYDVPQRVSAYEAINVVSIRVRAIGDLGGIIDALAQAGSNRLHGVGFELADPKPHLDEARRLAVADARARAELFAAAAGVTLGPVVSIRESAQIPGPIMMRAEAMADSAPPVAEGSLTLSAQVEIVYAIE